MRASTPRRMRLVGLAGLVVLAALVYLVFAGRLPFTPSFRIQATVASTNELKKGSPVRIAGVDVGQVVEMRSGPGDAATLVMKIADRGRPLHTDASLRIRPRLFLEGSFYVDLSPGSPSAPVLGDGGRIPLGHTAGPVQISQVLSTFTGDLRASLVGTLHELATGLGRGGATAFGRAARPVGDITRDAAIVAGAARGSGTHDTTELVQGASRLAAALASRNRQLAGLVGDLRTTTDVLAGHAEDLAVTVRNLDQVLTVAPPALRAVDAVLPDLRRFARTMRPSLRRLPPILQDGNAALEQAAALLAPHELPRLLASAGPAVRRLPTLTRRLQPLLSLVTPVSDCIRDRVLPVLFSAVKDGPLSTGQPAWLELLHSLIGTSGALQTIDGNGRAARVEASGGEESIVTAVAPGSGPLIGRVTDSQIASRPIPLGPGREPPLRPDAECRRQPMPDLDARTGTFAQPTRPNAARPPLKPDALRGILDGLSPRPQPTR